MPRNYFMLFYDFIEETEMLTDAERGRLVKAILQFARGEAVDEAALTGNERFLYPRFRRQAERDAEAYARRAAQNAENGRKGGRPRRADQEAENPMGYSETEKSQYKDKDEYKDENEDKDEDEGEDKAPAGTRRDAPHAPALDDVLDFCRENRLQTDPHTFWNHYQANGWRSGDHPIRDWQAKLREWEARGDVSAPFRADTPRAAPSNPALDYAQREYVDDDHYFIDLDAYDAAHASTGTQ